MLRFVTILALATCSSAYQPSKPHAPVFSSAWLREKAAAPVGAAMLALVVAQPAFGEAFVPSDTAAQISLNSIPPSSISVQIKDLPVVGKLASGVYSKLPDSETNDANKKPQSIVIQSPPNKAKAIQEILQTGHLEFDVKGVIQTHLDIDMAAEKAGILNVRVASPLIPKLPFENSASFASSNSPTGGKESPWNMVKNMGSGEVYYYNEKTGVTQFAKPSF